MRILIAHNAYQHRGGEDSVVDAEIALLRSYGHEVEPYFRHNNDVASSSMLAVAGQTLWSTQTTKDVEVRIAEFRPDVIHVHNTFPLVSPAIYWVAAKAGIPIVQTLHNFRFLCLSALFMRDGQVCEDCFGHLPWRGVVHKCYRNSTAASIVLAGMITLHRGLGSYRNKVTRYIALNDFCRNKFIAGGLPKDKFSVKPNFIDNLNTPDWEARQGGLFVGRLSKEKGLDVLAEAVKLLPINPVKIIGGGELESFAQFSFGTDYLGFQSLDTILAKMRQSSYLVLPSIWYENFPRTIVEAFACGLPVIASRIGALAEIIEDGRTGLLFESGNAQDLAEKLNWAEAHPDEMVKMGKSARAEYESRYTPERNYAMLFEIYKEAITANRAEL
ncbi:glycosyltransferase [Methylotenera sp.]|uniref:glycosyltransferase n=2 Tax=Methylotenera sp. TaxID=2051956 RepID=UPI00272EFE06|nr:glycosyltransferase [Methylotenera sp.]MDP1523625.1 glycosyltransferase [Methylotenera sp.]MDP2071644.1 glycosyltransferase [Methylotenera sp.]MDP3006734.1 glycosyltransferase [Methylotenera sp.]MDP3308410.1 glycosyltransferase [Methylotenera sp.]